MSAADSRGSMGRKPHYDVTKTDAQPSPKGTLKHEMSEDAPSGSVELKTPSGFLSGLSGINKASNSSSARNVGSGDYGDHTQSSRPGVDEGQKYPYPTGPNTTISGNSHNDNYGSKSSNNVKAPGPKTHKWE